MNLKNETLKKLKGNNKETTEVLWVGSPNYGYITFEEFLEISDFEYNDGYGSPGIAQDLVVVGQDWWLERHEYDGSEWWEFKSNILKPEKHLDGKISLGGDHIMWESLEKINS